MHFFEQYKTIQDFPTYSVSKTGSIKNNITGRILKQSKGNHGYQVVGLRNNGQTKIMTVHRIVANRYIANPENKRCIDHIDNDKTNNNINNLRFATHQENNRNAIIRKDNKSGFKGVHFNQNLNKWTANISIDGIVVHLGCFNNSEDAKNARKMKANEIFGDFCGDDERIKTELELLDEEFNRI